MWKCAQCGEFVEGDNYEFCWNCGAGRQAGQPAGKAPSMEADSPVQALFDRPRGARLITCPVCEARISSYAASCPRCGHPMKAEPATPSVATHREFLEEVIYPYKCAGYQVIQQTEYVVTMMKPHKRLSVALALVLYIFFWPAGVVYMLSRWNRRNKLTCFRVLPSGQVEISGDTLSGGERESNAGLMLMLACVGATLAVAAIFMLVRFR